MYANPNKMCNSQNVLKCTRAIDRIKNVFVWFQADAKTNYTLTPAKYFHGWWNITFPSQFRNINGICECWNRMFSNIVPAHSPGPYELFGCDLGALLCRNAFPSAISHPVRWWHRLGQDYWTIYYVCTFLICIYLRAWYLSFPEHLISHLRLYRRKTILNGVRTK